MVRSRVLRPAASLVLCLGGALLFAGCPGNRGISDGEDPVVAPGAQPLVPESTEHVTEEAPEGDCVCPMIHDPVCGEDGRTWGNDCMAACAGVAIAHRGECAPDGTAEVSGDEEREAGDGTGEGEDGETAAAAPVYRYHLCNDETPCDAGYVCVNVREGCRPSQCSGTPWEGFGICTRDCRMGYGVCVPEGMPVPSGL